MTIAQQLKVTKFPFIIKDKDGNQIYYEDSDGYWSKHERDALGNVIYYEDSDGTWRKCERDSNGNEIRYENSDGVWIKYEYDSNGKEIYWENSYGDIVDKRPKIVELTLQDIADKMGINVKQLRIKD